MNLWKNYHLAVSVDDALKALASASGPARIVAGGTDLLLDLQQGRHQPLHTLVDISAIPALTKLNIQDDALFIGAGVTHAQLEASPLVRTHALALAEACALIGGPQVRNVATLGGNVAHALPAADGTIALAALDAQAEVACFGETRRLPLLDLFAGPGASTLDPRADLLLGFYLPLGEAGTGSAFQRVMRPQGVAVAILNLAVWLRRAGERILDVRIAVGPSGPTPQRMTAAEDALRGQPFSDDAVQQAYEAILRQASFRTSRHRATKAYRQHIVGVLLAETLQAAFERAKS